MMSNMYLNLKCPQPHPLSDVSPFDTDQQEIITMSFSPDPDLVQSTDNESRSRRNRKSKKDRAKHTHCHKNASYLNASHVPRRMWSIWPANLSSGSRSPCSQKVSPSFPRAREWLEIQKQNVVRSQCNQAEHTDLDTSVGPQVLHQRMTGHPIGC